MPASSLDPMRIPENQRTATVAPESTLFFVGLQVGAFAALIDDLQDMVDDGAIVEMQLPIWGEAVE